MKRYWAFLSALVAWMTIVPSTRAQFICHVTEDMWIGENEYWYTSLSCDGNNCFASAIGGPSLLGPDMHLIFLHSLDGGATWNVQDPGFPGNWPMPYVTIIEQVDSLNIMAFGNAIIFRTSNGGAVWQQDTIPTTRPILEAS